MAYSCSYLFGIPKLGNSGAQNAKSLIYFVFWHRRKKRTRECSNNDFTSKISENPVTIPFWLFMGVLALPSAYRLPLLNIMKEFGWKLKNQGVRLIYYCIQVIIMERMLIQCIDLAENAQVMEIWCMKRMTFSIGWRVTGFTTVVSPISHVYTMEQRAIFSKIEKTT